MIALELIIAAMPFPTTVSIFLHFANWVCHRHHHICDNPKEGWEVHWTLHLILLFVGSFSQKHLKTVTPADFIHASTIFFLISKGGRGRGPCSFFPFQNCLVFPCSHNISLFAPCLRYSKHPHIRTYIFQVRLNKFLNKIGICSIFRLSTIIVGSRKFVPDTSDFKVIF